MDNQHLNIYHFKNRKENNMKEYPKIVEIHLPLYIDGEITNYTISDWGTITNIKNNKVMTSVRNNQNGYYRVCLSINKVARNFSVHRLVAQTFILNPDNKPTVNHKIPGDRGKSINAVWNLEWATHKEQTDHAIVNGIKTSLKGSNNIHATITEETAHKICKMLSECFSVEYISDLLDVNITIVNNILYKVAWVEVSDLYEIDTDKIQNKKFHKRSLDSEIISEILRLHELGMKPAKIFKTLNRSVPKYTINNILYRADYYPKEKEEFYKMINNSSTTIERIS